MKCTHTSCFTLLLLLVFGLPCLSQTDTISITPTDTFTTVFTSIASLCDGSTGPANTTALGNPVAAGTYVPGELIVRFNEPQSDQAKKDYQEVLEELGPIYVAEWSPSSKFARVVGLDFTTCEIVDGTGNPLGAGDGRGDGYDFNHIAGTQSWISNNDPTCILLNDDIDPYHDYYPTRFCDDSDLLSPPTGGKRINVAIIDSGLRGASDSRSVNGVNQTQTIIPGDCAMGQCEPIRGNTQEYSNAFSLHGSYIYYLISGWFRAKGLQNSINIHSYQILDADLRCTVFQGIKAIELAALEDNIDVINLSIGFQPTVCNKDPRPDTNPNPDVDSRTQTQAPYRSMLYFAIKDAGDEGVVVINSAGNNCADLTVSPQYPAADPHLDNLIVVGALECGSTTRPDWSNYSDQYVDLFTQGEAVRILQGGCYQKLYGTSFAAPIVAAKAAFHGTNHEEDFDPASTLCDLRSQAYAFEGSIYGAVKASANNGYCLSGDTPQIETTGLTANSTFGIFRAAPNPVRNGLKIIPTGDPGKFYGSATLLNSRGNTVLKQEVKGEELTLELNDLTAGIYFLYLVTEEGRAIRRIVKQ